MYRNQQQPTVDFYGQSALHAPVLTGSFFTPANDNYSLEARLHKERLPGVRSEEFRRPTIYGDGEDTIEDYGDQELVYDLEEATESLSEGGFDEEEAPLYEAVFAAYVFGLYDDDDEEDSLSPLNHYFSLDREDYSVLDLLPTANDEELEMEEELPEAA